MTEPTPSTEPTTAEPEATPPTPAEPDAARPDPTRPGGRTTRPDPIRPGGRTTRPYPTRPYPTRPYPTRPTGDIPLGTGPTGTSPSGSDRPDTGSGRPVAGSGRPVAGSSARYASARRALAVVVAALLIATLANADELSRTAASQPLGPRHDQLVDATAFLRRLAGPLRLTTPRRALESATGRRRPDPDAAEQAISPTETAPATTADTPTATDRPRPPTAERPLRLAVVGDSVMIALGQAIVERAGTGGVVDATLDARYATGLTRPDRFDWPGRLATIVAEDDPDAVMLLFGANDAQGIVTATGEAAAFGTEAWTTEYRRRVERLMTALDTDGRSVYWLGQPVMRDDALSARMQLIDDIVQAAAAAHPGVRFLPLRSLTAGADGGYRAFLPGPDGTPVAARADDGVHFSAAGADVVARQVVAVVQDDWRIEE